ncbi:hypothetical protein EBQ81_01160 [bacterium]|nr:hypothetical protein [bacterium]
MDTPEFIAAALLLNAEIKRIHKRMDIVGYKSDEGRELGNLNTQLYMEFAAIWGGDALTRAKFITHSKSPAHRTHINKRSKEEY